MRVSRNFLYPIFLLLLLGSTLCARSIEQVFVLEPSSEYVAPELPHITLDGGIEQWFDLIPLSVILEDITGSGDNIQLQAYFAYNDSKLFIGILVPKDKEVSGLEIIFIGNDGVFDGIIIDRELEEARDATYINNTYVTYDSVLGGYEDVNVVISETGDDEFYMIVEDTRFPENDIGSDWVFDEGDSVAVVFQAWVGKLKTPTNRPNFSTCTFGLNFVLLSIKMELPDYHLDLHTQINPGKYSENYQSYYADELNIILDGKKDEGFWLRAPTYQVTTYLIDETAANSLINSPNPSIKFVNLTITRDEDELFLFLEIPKDDIDSVLSELTLVFSVEDNCLYNLSSTLFVCQINPEETSYLFAGLNADFKDPGIVSEITHVVSTVSTYAIQGLTYESFRNYGDHSVESVEASLPLYATADYPGIFGSGIGHDLPSKSDIQLADLSFNISTVDSSNPRTSPWSERIMDGEQLKHIIHRIEVDDESSPTTETNIEIGVSVFLTLVFLTTEILLSRKRRKINDRR